MYYNLWYLEIKQIRKFYPPPLQAPSPTPLGISFGWYLKFRFKWEKRKKEKVTAFIYRKYPELVNFCF